MNPIFKDLSPQDQLVVDVFSKVPRSPDGELAFDVCASPIKFSHYGDRDSEFGWEIDHIVPESRGGASHLDNYQPLQWENNLAKDNRTQEEWDCSKDQ